MGLAVSRHERFMESCGFGHVLRVQQFLDEGEIDVNWKSDVHQSCAIHLASQAHLEVVKVLLAHKGCNVDLLDDRGHSALHHAAMRGRADIIALLLDAGCSVDIQSMNGWTPLICSAYFGHLEAAEMLLKHNADVMIANNEFRTALHELCRCKSVGQDEADQIKLYKLAKALLQHGADANQCAMNTFGADFTPLMFASYHGHDGIVRALVEDADCDVNFTSSHGITALAIARDQQYDVVVDYLSSLPSTIKTPTKSGINLKDFALATASKGFVSPRMLEYAGIPIPVLLPPPDKTRDDEILARIHQKKTNVEPDTQSMFGYATLPARHTAATRNIVRRGLESHHHNNNNGNNNNNSEEANFTPLPSSIAIQPEITQQAVMKTSTPATATATNARTTLSSKTQLTTRTSVQQRPTSAQVNNGKPAVVAPSKSKPQSHQPQARSSISLNCASGIMSSSAKKQKSTASASSSTSSLNCGSGATPKRRPSSGQAVKQNGQKQMPVPASAIAQQQQQQSGGRTSTARPLVAGSMKQPVQRVKASANGSGKSPPVRKTTPV